jgi:hypothetical protein
MCKDDIEIELGFHDELEDAQKVGTPMYMSVQFPCLTCLFSYHLDIPLCENMGCTQSQRRD